MLRDLSDYRVIQRFKGHVHSVFGVALSPDNKLAYTGQSGGITSIYDAESGECLLRRFLAKDRDAFFAFTDDGYYDGPPERAAELFAYVKGLEPLQGDEKKQMLDYYRKPGLAKARLAEYWR